MSPSTIEINNSPTFKSKIRILIAEDNPSNQKVLIKFLKKLGYNNIIIANDGLEMIEHIRKAKQPFHIVFVDLVMPVIDGLEAMKIINQEGLKNISIYVATTATVTDDTKRTCFKHKMDSFIPKPIDIEELKKKMISFVGKFNEF